MLNVDEALKTIYKNDMFPLCEEITPKDLQIIFPGMDPIHADQMVDDSFFLDEGIISDNNIRFGTCRASQIKFILANAPDGLKGKEFNIDQLIAGYTVPLGKYKVDSATLQDDLIFKDIVAYDKLRDIDIDVSAWYNSLFPIGNETYTLAAFRASLITYLGIEEELRTLPNDSMTVPKTIEPSQISGRVVLEACEELNGTFGHINRLGKFVHVILEPAYGLYPSADLLPAEDLYPVSETDTTYIMPGAIAETISQSMYKEDGVRFEEYTVKEIDKLQIRSEEDDIGAIVGEGSNCYVIEGNFLVFGKSASELEQIAWNAYSNIAKRPYRPYQSDEIGLPYLEVGDMKEYSTDTPIRSYMLHRTLTGIQALNDETGAEGSEECEQNFGVNKQITQLQGKQAIIKKTVEEVAVSVTNLDLALTGEMNVLAGQVVLKVMADGRIAAVDLTADPATGTAIVLKADNIKMEGLVTANSNFKILADGSIEVVNGKFSGVLTSPTVNGGNINGATIVSSDGTYTTTISNGSVTSTAIWAEALIVSNTIAIGANINLYASSGTVSATNVNCTNVNCTNINGYTPVHLGNISNQYVHWADYAGTAQTAGTANYANDAGSAPLSYDWVNAIKMNVGALSSKTQTALPVPWPA